MILLFAVLVLQVAFCDLKTTYAVQFHRTSLSGDKAYSGVEVQAEDGGFIVAGRTSSPAGQVVKYDKTGAKEWAKLYAGHTYGSADYQIRSIKETNGGFVLAGDVKVSSGSNQIWVFKIASTGSVIWSRLLGGSLVDEAREIAIDTDDGIILTGYVRSSGSASCLGSNCRYGVIVKYHSNGTFLWGRRFGNTDVETYSYSVKVIPGSGDYILAGKTSVSGSEDAFVVKVKKSDMTKAWGQTYKSSSGGDYINGIDTTSDGFIALGYYYKSGAGTAGVIALMKLTSTGGIAWAKYYGSGASDKPNRVITTHDGGFYASGRWGSESWLVTKFTATGVLEWRKQIGSGGSFPYDVFLSKDKGALFTGSTGGAENFFAVKLHEDGSGGCDKAMDIDDSQWKYGDAGSDLGASAWTTGVWADVKTTDGWSEYSWVPSVNEITVPAKDETICFKQTEVSSDSSVLLFFGVLALVLIL